MTVCDSSRTGDLLLADLCMLLLSRQLLLKGTKRPDSRSALNIQLAHAGLWQSWWTVLKLASCGPSWWSSAPAQSVLQIYKPTLNQTRTGVEPGGKRLSPGKRKPVAIMAFPHANFAQLLGEKVLHICKSGTTQHVLN